MEIGRRKEGYGYLIKWLIGLGDMVMINLSSALLYNGLRLLGFFENGIGSNHISSIFLLINLAYFIAASIISRRLSSNIIFFDRIIRQSIAFISLYYILFTVGVALFQTINYVLTDWALFFVGLSLLYCLWHILLRSIIKLYRSKGYNFKRIVIVGGGQRALAVYNELKSGDYGYKILGVFENSPEQKYPALNHLGSLSEVEKYCIENNVDEIYCTLDNNRESEIIGLVNFSEQNMIRFFLIPEFYGYIRRKLVLNFLQSIPVVAIRPEPMQLFYNRIIKRSFDIIFSIMVLTTIFPIVFIVFGFLIKITSKGSIIFRQQRTGLQGKPFTCYKFRSMRLNKEADIRTATQSDSRITKVGKFIRRTSIDELPQFYNVFIGNMSVVGPRPHMIKQTDLYNELIDKFMIRHITKPGISGWAQISGYRGETKTIEQMEGRFKRDVWYIENWSFILDIKIIIVTIYQILKGDDKAY